jgi:hypothetical protein
MVVFYGAMKPNVHGEGDQYTYTYMVSRAMSDPSEKVLEWSVEVNR